MGHRPSTRVEAVLDEPCIRYGYCLPPDKRSAIEARPPGDPDSFLEAVLRGEGFVPDDLAKADYRALRSVIEDWLFDAGNGKGARSGLP